MFRKSRFNPGPGLADFWQEFRKPTPHRWPILVVSVLPISLVIMWASGEKVVNPLERPQVTYITSFAPDRSDAEIAASNEENQRIQDARRAEIEEIEEKKKELYRALGRASGMDVDAMERQIAEEEAAEEAAAQDKAQPSAPAASSEN
jgi:flagellar biosynthesis GTPase FlhF